MGIRNTAAGWGWPARLLHWGMVGLIGYMSWLGLYMTSAFAPGDFAAFPWYQTHKSWGTAVFALVLLRLAWRGLNPTPAAPAAMPAWERAVASASHAALYLLMLALPVSGWLMVSASPLQDLGVPNQVFGLFDLPDPFPPGGMEMEGKKALEDALKEVHGTLWVLLMLVVGLHVLGALKHHLVARDGVLRRMVLGR